MLENIDKQPEPRVVHGTYDDAGVLRDAQGAALPTSSHAGMGVHAVIWDVPQTEVKT